jgi:hypothetical protein
MLSTLLTVFVLAQSAPSQQSDVDRLRAISMCAERARTFGPTAIEWLKKQGDSGISTNAKQEKGEHTAANTLDWAHSGHFNAEQQRCFVEVTISIEHIFTPEKGKQKFTLSKVYDAFEGRLVGRGSFLKTLSTGETEALDCYIGERFVRGAEYRALMEK